MKKITYIVQPGYVRSVNDGELHYINGRKLMDLYRVDKRQCVVETDGTETRGLRGTFTILEPKDHAHEYQIKLCRKETR